MNPKKELLWDPWVNTEAHTTVEAKKLETQ